MVREGAGVLWRVALGASCWASIAGLSLGTAWADAPAADPQGEVHRAESFEEEAGHEAAADTHSGESGAGHHDPYDLTAANAGEMQQDFTELRTDLALATLVVFLVLLAILWKFAWAPISEALDRREKGIADQLSEARRNNEEAHRLLAEHRQRLDRAAEEVRGLLDQARHDGESLKQRMVSEAEQVATAQKERALREIDAAKNGALEELARKSIDQAVGLAGRIVGKQLKKEDHAQLIQDALERIPSHNAR